MIGNLYLINITTFRIILLSQLCCCYSDKNGTVVSCGIAQILKRDNVSVFGVNCITNFRLVHMYLLYELRFEPELGMPQDFFSGGLMLRHMPF